MKIIKAKITAIIGAISAFLGSVGIVIAELGLCACILAPIFSLAGVIAIVMWFLSQNKAYFLVIGVVFLLVSFVFYKRKEVCKRHGKGKRKIKISN